MSPFLIQAVGAAALPFGVAAVVAALGSRGEAGSARGRLALPLALVGAYLAAHLWTQGRPAWPFVGVIQGLAYFAVSAGLLAGLTPLLGRARMLGTGALAAVAIWILFAFHREAHWEGAEIGVRIGALALVPVGLAALLAPGARRAPGLVGAQLVAVAGLTAGCLALSGSVALAQLAGALAAGLAAILAIARFSNSGAFVPALGSTFALLLGGLLLAGLWVSELPRSSALALVGAVALVGPVHLVRKEDESKVVTALRLLAPLAVGALALYLAQRAAPPSSPYGY